MARDDTPAGLLARALASDPGRPFVTFYDDATGERVELSVATFDNWVAKTANLLRDGLDAEPGDRLAVMLPTHWQGAIWMLAGWTAGLVVDFDSAINAEVVVTGPDTVDAAIAVGAGEVVALSLRPLGGSSTTALPDGVLDYASEVSSYGDQFVPDDPDDADPALVAAARARADQLGLAEGARLLTDANPAAPGGHLDALLAPLAVNGSVVLLRNPDPDRIDRHATDEKVTTRALSGT